MFNGQLMTRQCSKSELMKVFFIGIKNHLTNSFHFYVFQTAAKNTNNLSSRLARRRANRNCGLAQMPLKVAALGLGYTSPEVVVFRYCIGTCQPAVSMHGRVLNNLIQTGKVSKQTCCSPSEFADVAFYEDAVGEHRILKNFNAKKCDCF